VSVNPISTQSLRIKEPRRKPSAGATIPTDVTKPLQKLSFCSVRKARLKQIIILYYINLNRSIDSLIELAMYSVSCKFHGANN